MKKWTIVALALVVTVGCGSDGNPDPTTLPMSTNTSTTTDTGTGLGAPGSAFIPVQIEQVIESLVAATQATGKDPTQTPVEVLLKQTDGYFAPMVVGANRITSRLGCPSNVEAALFDQTGTNEEIQKSKVDSQIALIQSYADNSPYRAMGIAPLGSDEETAAALDSFIAQRGPVVTIDSDTPTSQRAYYIGTDNFSAGAAAARELAKVLQPGDTMAVFGTTEENWKSGYERASGAEAGGAEAGLVVAPRIHPTWDAESDLASLTTALQDPALNIKGLVCCYSNSNLCAVAVENLGLKGVVQIVGFDFTTDTKPWFDKGYFHALAGQRPYYMGVLAALVPYAINVIGAEATAAYLQPLLVAPQTIDTGLDIVTSEAYADYMAYLSQLGVNS